MWTFLTSGPSIRIASAGSSLMKALLQTSKFTPTSGPISFAVSAMSFAVGRKVKGTFSRRMLTPVPFA
jgi:hypothetical protein